MGDAAEEWLSGTAVGRVLGMGRTMGLAFVERLAAVARRGRVRRTDVEAFVAHGALPPACDTPKFRALIRRRARQSIGDRHWCTYVVHAPSAGLVKIGQSKSWQSRWTVLQAGSPVPLRLVALFAGVDLELALHARFIEHRSHSEWFAARPVLDWLQSLGVIND